jgi:hypothetical protein
MVHSSMILSVVIEIDSAKVTALLYIKFTGSYVNVLCFNL